MKLTKGIITREQAMAIAPDYVLFVEGDWDKCEKVYEAMNKLRRGQSAITHYDKQFIKVKVTSVDSKSFQAVDGPVIRVGNGEYTWRVDGCGNAFPA